ncbi:hypothetical protein WN943_016229 [Citrus x changshan-huyou]
MGALRVSYHYLPSYVKRCFAYCSFLPKGYRFDERQIVLLWMAEGLLQHETYGKQMEELGRKSFQVLHSRSFFQWSKIDASRFLMHDLIHDLACWAFGEISSSMESTWDGNNERRFSRNLRHLSYLTSQFDGIKRFEGLHKVEYLRTFLALLLGTRKTFYVTNNLVFHVVPRLRQLRVVSLCGYKIVQLPNDIAELKHLRYLDFSHTAIEVLPESVNVGNLVNLRHLKDSHSNLLEEMPLRIGKLTSLRTLAKFVVGKGNCYGLKELRSLMHLQEKLTISGLENVNDAEDAKEAQLNGKEKLEALSLKWGNSTTSSDSREVAEIQTRVFEMLKPHYGLKELKVRGYGGTKFPAWLGQSSFENLVVLRFKNCNQCTTLPSVGHLPSLKNLVIKGMAKVKSVGLEFCGKYCSEPFPSLETLCFEDMQEWEEWISHGGTAGGDQEAAKGFRRLRELFIVSCSKLKVENNVPMVANEKNNRVAETGGNKFGTWMVVSRKSKPRNYVGKNFSHGTVEEQLIVYHSKSHFDVLASQDPGDNEHQYVATETQEKETSHADPKQPRKHYALQPYAPEFKHRHSTRISSKIADKGKSSTATKETITIR